MFPFIAMFRLTSEASTLFINIRWTLLLLKLKHTQVYAWNGILILVTFTLFRVLPIAPIWYSFARLIDLPAWPDVHIGFKCLCVGSSIPLDALNLFWYFKIVRMALKMMLNTTTTKQQLDKND